MVMGHLRSRLDGVVTDYTCYGVVRRAPGAPTLDLVIDFVNTLDVDAGSDELSSPAALGAWLAERGLLQAGAPVGGRSSARRCACARRCAR